MDCRPPSRGERELEDQEEVEEEDIHPVALEPDASLPEEPLQTPSPLQSLDELLSLGKISRAKVAKLKSIYRMLQDTLKSTQDSEIHLFEEAKRCCAELEGLRANGEQAEEQSTSEKPESEVNDLRQQLLRAYNELEAAEDREYEMQHELKCLREEKQILQKENRTQLKPAELESRTKALQDKHDDLRKEVTQRQLEIRSLMEDLETQEKQILNGWKELEDKKEIIELKEAEKAQLIGVPDQILKEIERKRSKKEAAMKKIEALDAEISDMERQVKDAEQRNHSLRSKMEQLNEELEGIRAQGEASRRKHRQLFKEQEVRREEQMDLLGSRGILEMKLQSIECDRKHLYESHSVQRRERNRQMEALKRMERVLAAATERLENTQSIYHKLQTQLDAVPKVEASVQQRMELQREVDALKVSLEKQLLVAEEKSQKKQQYGMIQELLRESNSRREELHNLRCLTKIKAEERGQKHRELLRAEQLNQHIQEELLEKDLIITDHNKLNTTLQRRLAQYCKLCRMITEEKNKYVKLKQIAAQTITELREQLQVKENEVEIQRSVVIAKDRSLTKARVKLNNSSKIRDKFRNDISKVNWKHRQICQEFEDNKLELTRLAQMLKLREEALTEINKNHETAIQSRNFLGIQLMEHDEALLNCNKKVNIQDMAITKGNMALEIAEKEIKDLELEIREAKRQIGLKKKEVLLEKRLEGEITTLQIELAEATDKTLEILSQTAEYKELQGKDPSSVDLVKRIKELEVNLAQRERQVLEKKLLVDRVTRLSKPLSEQVENCQQDRLSLAKKLNEVRTNITETDQRLMAVTAELSIKQASTLSLQQEIKEKEQQIDRCLERLEQGLPPCPEMEEEWRTMLRDKKRRQREKEESRKLAEEDDWKLLPDGEYTTAEPRPNAYVPQTDPLPLPKPYGAQAPFKPSQPGANMRHIRKPTLKSLEV